ncbi:hypothetical protein CEXT_487121 [Caerostris extrusa]|uniref:Uncharacterized protein n=1 Tax=Caerostris extrusa TaxID=172846 RepID=A0AAV4MGR8_CAEEX|nr:hypothetical protein CEXT_487121 [Caerostris extrusa]
MKERNGPESLTDLGVEWGGSTFITPRVAACGEGCFNSHHVNKEGSEELLVPSSCFVFTHLSLTHSLSSPFLFFLFLSLFFSIL